MIFSYHTRIGMKITLILTNESNHNKLQQGDSESIIFIIFISSPMYGPSFISWLFALSLGGGVEWMQHWPSPAKLFLPSNW